MKLKITETIETQQKDLLAKLALLHTASETVAKTSELLVQVRNLNVPDPPLRNLAIVLAMSRIHLPGRRFRMRASIAFHKAVKSSLQVWKIFPGMLSSLKVAATEILRGLWRRCANYLKGSNDLR